MLAQAGGLPAELEQTAAPRAKAVHGPFREPEEPQLLGRVWFDGKAVGVVGMPLCLANFLGIAVAPDAAFAQEPVRGQPAAAQQERRPPRDSPRARRPTRDPSTISTSPEAMKSIEMDIGGPLMPRSKSRAMVRSLVSFGSLEVAHPGWPHAGGGEPVVEPRGGPAAKIGADGLVDRC